MPMYKNEKDQKSYLVPTPGNIRTAMQATGWNAYTAYCMLHAISKAQGVSFQDVVQNKLWNDDKYSQACQIAAGECVNALPLREGSEALLDEASFEEFFYTKKQLESIRAIREGRLTLKILFQFLKLDLSHLDRINLDRNADISDKINYTLAGVVPGDVFFCIRKGNVNVDAILRHKPACVITGPGFQKQLEGLEIPVISRIFLRSYLIELSALWKTNYPGKTVAITGSVGKTTTTEMIGQVLSAERKVFRAIGNQNTTDQIAQFVFKLKPDTDAFVQECSGSYLSQLENSAQVIRPDCFVVTNVGNGHIGNYRGKVELLLYEKIALDRNAAPGAVGVINWDDERLKHVRYQHPIIRCAIRDKSADLVGENVVERDGILSFDVVENNTGGRRTHVVLNVCGEHNVYNALSAFAVGLQMGLSRDVIVEALSSYKPRAVRQNLVWLSGQHVYIDCYSVTVESMETAMRVMETISVHEGKKKIAVLSDVPDLGDGSEEMHRKIGRMVAEVNSADKVFFYGPESKAAMEEAAAAKVDCRHTEDRATLEQWLREEADSTGLIAFKASHKYALQWVLDDLFGTAFYAYDELTIRAPRETVDKAYYKCIENYGSVLMSADKVTKTINFPETVRELPVRIVGRSAFQGGALSAAELPAQLKTIADGAFRDCRELQSVSFPASLCFIGAGAFSGCKALEELDLSKGCCTIGAEAFRDCSALKCVRLPENLKTISDTAFDADTQAVFHCPAGSYAEQWAKANGKTVVSSNA